MKMISEKLSNKGIHHLLKCLKMFPLGIMGLSGSAVCAYAVNMDLNQQGDFTPPTINPYVSSTPVGGIGGSLSVDTNGGVSYSIGIQVPPGTSDIEPQLALVYDSQGSNSYVGMGFSLRGISQISRCQKSKRIDGIALSPLYTSNDAFCIDGQRIVLGDTSTSGYYMVSQTWSRFIPVGNCVGGPCSFTVLANDGSIVEYGGTTNSRFLAEGKNGAIMSWANNKISDPNGNEIYFNYINLPGQFYVDSINYTSNNLTGAPALRQVKFFYDDRIDLQRSYAGASFSEVRKRLKNIHTYVYGNPFDNQELVLNYTLSYEYASPSNISRLVRIDKCDNQIVCLNPTTFTYQDASTNFSAPVDSLPGGANIYSITSANDVRFEGGLVIDINGDGIPDFSKATRVFGGGDDLGVYLGRGDGTFSSTPAFNLPGYVYITINSVTYESGILQDLNMDGIPDFVQATRFDGNNSPTNIFYGNGTGFYTNGNQLPGFVFDVLTTASNVCGMKNVPFRIGDIVDINGDGFPDLATSAYFFKPPYAPDVSSCDSGNFDQIKYTYLGSANGFSTSFYPSLPNYKYVLNQRYLSKTRYWSFGMIADFDGDGIADFTQATKFIGPFFGPLVSEKRVYYGQPGGGYQDIPTLYDLPDFLFVARNTEGLDFYTLKIATITDFNGDGRLDYSRASLPNTGAVDNVIYLQNQNRQMSPSYALPGSLFYVTLGPENYPDSVKTVGLVLDVNSDGIVDFTIGNSTHRDIFLGTGQGFEKRGQLPANKYIFKSPGQQYATLQDFNGDGYADFSSAREGDLGVYLGVGDGTFQPYASFDLPTYIFKDSNDKVSESSLIEDFNGDGIQDFCKATTVEGESQPYPNYTQIYLGPNPFPHLMSKINNGGGGTTSIFYATMFNSTVYTLGKGAIYPIQDLRRPTLLVSSTSIQDGRGNVYTNDHFYEAARFDQVNREWLGFNVKKVYNPQINRTTLTYFNQTYPYTSQPYRSEVRLGKGSSGTLLSLTQMAQANVNNALYFPKNTMIVPSFEETQFFSVDGVYMYTMKKSYHYTSPSNPVAIPGLPHSDTFGNLRYVHDWGDVADDSDDLHTYYLYYSELFQKVGIPLARRITSVPTDTPFPYASPGSSPFNPSFNPFPSQWDNSLDLEWSKTTYDSSSRLQVITSSTFDSTNLAWVGSFNSYDVYGNLISNCRLSDYTAGSCLAGKDIQFTYDPIYHSFLTSISSPVNSNGTRFLAHMGFEPRFGVRVWGVDYNGYMSHLDVDNHGRIASHYLTPPYSGEPTKVTTSSLFMADALTYSEDRVRITWADDNTANWLYSQNYIDGIGRSYLQVRLATLPNQLIQQRVGYDLVGRSNQTYLPYFSTDDPSSVPYSWVDYDIFDRVNKSVSTDGSVSLALYDYDCVSQSFAPRKQCAVAAAGTPLVRNDTVTFNSRGSRIAQIMPNNGVINYVLNKLQQTLQIIDPKGLTTNMTYDSLGRVTQSAQPDSGSTQVTYDIRGLVVKVVDSIGQSVQTTYDNLDRPLLYSAFDSNGAWVENITYAYDKAGAEWNGIGALYQVSNRHKDSSGEYSYEFAYYCDQSIKSVNTTIKALGKSYWFRFFYDKPGLTTAIHYPANLWLNMTYYQDGSLEKILLTKPGQPPKTIVTYKLYNALGQVGQAVLGDGVLTKNYTYSLPQDEANYVTGALKNTQFYNSTTLNSNMNYGWDKLHELTAKSDTTPNPDNAFSQTYGYDSTKMGYLTQTEGTRYNINYEYDKLGSVIKRNGLSYLYKPKSNQVQQTSDGFVVTNWDFDGVGRLESKAVGADLWGYQYTPEGKLAGVSRNATQMMSAYYNHAGTRFLKEDATGTRVFYLGWGYKLIQYPNGTIQTTLNVGGLHGKIYSLSFVEGQTDFSTQVGR